MRILIAREGVGSFGNTFLFVNGTKIPQTSTAFCARRILIVRSSSSHAVAERRQFEVLVVRLTQPPLLIDQFLVHTIRCTLHQIETAKPKYQQLWKEPNEWSSNIIQNERTRKRKDRRRAEIVRRSDRAGGRFFAAPRSQRGGAPDAVSRQRRSAWNRFDVPRTREAVSPREAGQFAMVVPLPRKRGRDASLQTAELPACSRSPDCLPASALYKF